MSQPTAKAKPADDPSFQLPASISALAAPLLIAGLAALAIGTAIGLLAGPGDGLGPRRFTMSLYLTAFTYCFTISLGCLFFVLIQHLCRAGWSVVVRRVAEILMIALPGLAILFVPVLLAAWSSGGVLYPWSDPGYAEAHGIPAVVWQAKTSYLTPGWFALRAVFYLAILSGIALYFFKLSRRQDETGEVTLTERLQACSGPATIIFSLVTTFAAFDWLMSLAPMWFSTMFGVYLFAGSVLAAHSAIIAVVYLLQQRGAIRDEVTVEHYHDFGKYLFGFITFWTYIAFSQFMLIWYGNIPEETSWFYTRMQGPWLPIGYALIFFHWMLPFLALMSRQVRRKPKWVFGWAVYLLVVHFFDIYWMVMPETGPTAGGAGGVLATVLLTLGMFALYLGGILWFTHNNKVKVLPVRDPRLSESLAFENI